MPNCPCLNCKNTYNFLNYSSWNEDSSHTDVNGKWGGRLATIVHYSRKGTDKKLTEVYLHLGEYYEIGRFEEYYEYDKSPTRFQTGKLIMDCVRESEHLSLLYFLLKIVVWIERLFR